jgi:hypothetical protein
MVRITDVSGELSVSFFGAEVTMAMASSRDHRKLQSCSHHAVHSNSCDTREVGICYDIHCCTNEYESSSFGFIFFISLCASIIGLGKTREIELIEIWAYFTSGL